jgi:hypothetical protein
MNNEKGGEGKKLSDISDAFDKRKDKERDRERDRENERVVRCIYVLALLYIINTQIMQENQSLVRLSIACGVYAKENLRLNKKIE